MKAKPVRIATPDATGFVVSTGRRDQLVAWQDVEQITAFKRDLYTVDMVCLLFRYGPGPSILECNEHMDGYNELVAALETYLPNATPWAQWFLTVAFPAFAPNPLCIYRRHGQPDPLPPPPDPDAPPQPDEETPLWSRGAAWLLSTFLFRKH